MNILDLPLLPNPMEEELADSATIIRHDRWLLDRIRAHIPACEGESQWSFFTGNYRAHEEDRKKHPGEEGIAPKRAASLTGGTIPYTLAAPGLP